MNSPAAEEYFRRQVAYQDAMLWIMAIVFLIYGVNAAFVWWQGRKN